MKKRVRFVVSGNVQQTGYRDFVFELVSGMDIKGTVKNLNDETVEVIAEGEEALLEKLGKLLDTKQFPIKVDKVEESYSEYTGEFKNFKIVFEEGNEAVLERLGTAARYLRQLGDKVDANGIEIKSVGQEINEFRQESSNNSGVLHREILEVLRELKEERKEHRQEIKELLVTIVNLNK